MMTHLLGVEARSLRHLRATCLGVGCRRSGSPHLYALIRARQTRKRIAINAFERRPARLSRSVGEGHPAKPWAANSVIARE
jgi:hypothetical protein